MPTNTELAQQIFDAINAHDLEALRGIWADDVEERFPDKTCRGKDELAALLRGAVRGDAGLPHGAGRPPSRRARRCSPAGADRHAHGRQFNGIDPTGKAITLDGMDEFTFRDGKMASNFVVFDQMEVGRQLGLLPPDGSPPDRALKAAFNAKTKIAEAIRNAPQRLGAGQLGGARSPGARRGRAAPRAARASARCRRRARR